MEQEILDLKHTIDALEFQNRDLVARLDLLHESYDEISEKNKELTKALTQVHDIIYPIL